MSWEQIPLKSYYDGMTNCYYMGWHIVEVRSLKSEVRSKTLMGSGFKPNALYLIQLHTAIFVFS
ncbi:hypothetical protein VB715_08720 [Crocosphaera sp. UHCC 0190]|uniref:hypothetical protein n=1 Tax=Crocosphaera sp. UHCC 0190 TaxID=3110246 RepID=UPI002B1EAB18|nr:hypothetical protein [Crocosphaera sp. UHCC 0190]MEA5509845.1 hypothetical protein [Crocosphaera sp. UHCC 0190]